MKTDQVIWVSMLEINLKTPLPADLIHHSDRACQKLQMQHDMFQCMSHNDNYWNSVVVERFFSRLKWEWTDDRLYRAQQVLIADVMGYSGVL